MHPRPRGVECRCDFGQHASGDGPVRKEFVDTFGGQPRQKPPLFIEHARRVGQEDEFLGLEDLGNFACDHIGIDVVGLPCRSHPNRCDDRNKACARERLDE